MGNSGMTLERWLESWPYIGRNVVQDKPGAFAAPDGQSGYVVADAPREHIRTWAWDLDDYLVSSVQAGSIWFVPREAR
jgi:hypothetical protein